MRETIRRWLGGAERRALPYLSALVKWLALALATGSPVLGALAVPVFAAPIALLQFGGEAGLAMLAAAGLTLWCWRPALQGLVPPPPRRPGGPGGMG